MQFLLLLPELPYARDGAFLGRVANDGRSKAVRHRRATALPIRRGYQIIALCHEADTGVVADSMRDEFEVSRIEVSSVDVESNSCRAFARVHARVRCSNLERSGLVQLAHRLSLMPAVRGVRWESIPGAAAGAGRIANHSA